MLLRLVWCASLETGSAPTVLTAPALAHATLPAINAEDRPLPTASLESARLITTKSGSRVSAWFVTPLAGGTAQGPATKTAGRNKQAALLATHCQEQNAD